MWNLKYDTNEPVYETESTTWRTDLWWGEGWRRDGIRGWGQQIKAFIHRTDKQLDPTV